MHQGKATNFYRQKVGYQFSDKIFFGVQGVRYQFCGAAVAILLLAVQNTTYFG